MDNRTGLKRRQYVRAYDKIPIYYEIAGDDEKSLEDSNTWELMIDDMDMRTEENPRLYEILFDINQKLDILVNHLTDKTGFNMPEAREVSIGGGGLSFNCAESFDEGDRLVIKTFLPVYAHVIRLSCEVVRCVPKDDGGFEVAVKFVNLDEGTRDKIIRYIFAKQRKTLRTEKEDGGARGGVKH